MTRHTANSRPKWLLPLALLTATVGCSATYTSIDPAGENAYYLTRTKQGFFKTSGALYFCEGQGKKLMCTLVDSR